MGWFGMITSVTITRYQIYFPEALFGCIVIRICWCIHIYFKKNLVTEKSTQHRVPVDCGQ